MACYLWLLKHLHTVALQKHCQVYKYGISVYMQIKIKAEYLPS